MLNSVEGVFIWTRAEPTALERVALYSSKEQLTITSITSLTAAESLRRKGASYTEEIDMGPVTGSTLTEEFTHVLFAQTVELDTDETNDAFPVIGCVDQTPRVFESRYVKASTSAVALVKQEYAGDVPVHTPGVIAARTNGSNVQFMKNE